MKEIMADVRLPHREWCAMCESYCLSEFLVCNSFGSKKPIALLETMSFCSYPVSAAVAPFNKLVYR